MEIPAEQVVLLHLSQLDYFDIFMKYTEHSPMLNPRCLTELSFMYLEGSGSVSDFCDRAQFLFKDDETCYTVFKSIMMRFTIIPEVGLDLFLRAIEDFLHSSAGRLVLFSNKLNVFFELFSDILYIYKPEHPELYDLLHIYRDNGAIRGALRRGFFGAAAIIKNRCNIYKEELVAAAWAPSRVEKWLQYGGIESLDD